MQFKLIAICYSTWTYAECVFIDLRLNLFTNIKKRRLISQMGMEYDKHIPKIIVCIVLNNIITFKENAST